MARIRSIKPEFWTSAQVMECSALARLLFIGMWNFADDAGRMTYSAKTLKAQIFPSDDISVANVQRLVDELSTNGLVRVYEVDGRQYLHITGWHHQKVDKPKESKIPGPVAEQSSNDRRRVATDPILVEGSRREGSQPDPDEMVETRAREPASKSQFTEGSKALAAAFWIAVGFENPLDIPPQLAGVDWRAVEWERAGWTVDLIGTEAKRLALDRPLKPLTYFEKVFATAFAKRQAPLPVVEVREAEKLTVTHGPGKPQSRSGSLIASLDREIADLESQEAADLEMPEGSFRRLSS